MAPSVVCCGAPVVAGLALALALPFVPFVEQVLGLPEEVAFELKHLTLQVSDAVDDGSLDIPEAREGLGLEPLKTP